MRLKSETQQEYEAEDSLQHRENKAIGSYLKAAVFAFSGFCFSQLDALGELSPFTAAFLSAVNFEYCFPAFIFSSLGYFLSRQWLLALRYIISSGVLCLIRLVIIRRFPHKDKSNVQSVAVFLSLSAVGTAFLFFRDFNYISFFLVLCEGFIAFCASVFFIRSFRTPVMKTGLSSLGVRDSTSLVISLGIFLMCLSDFTLEGLSPGRIFSCLALMLLSFIRGTSAGAVAGACIGTALSVAPETRYLFVCFALSGLISGVFSALGQIACALSYAAVFVAAALMQSSGSEVLISIIEAVVASAGFMVLPGDKINTVEDFLRKKGFAPDNPLSRQVSENLCAAADNICKVSDIVAGVSSKLDSVINPEVNRIFAGLQQRVCVGCEKKSECWNRLFDSTASDILAVSGIEKHRGGRTSLEKRCLRPEALIPEIRESYSEYARDMAAKMKAREMRRVLTDQFGFMGDFLRYTAEKIAGSRVPDPAKAAALRTALQDAGIYTDALSYFSDGDGRVRIEISIIDRPFEADRKKLKNILEFILKRRFGEAVINVGDVKTTISFEEKYLYELNWGYCSKALDKKGMCGDSVVAVQDSDGRKTVIISDGMGTGGRAAIDSSMTTAMLSALIEGGFCLEGAIKSVNSAMIMKSTDESIATVDAVAVNLFTAKADFYKAGAALSFIRRDKQVQTLRLESLPVGIIRNIEPGHTSCSLSAGDIILLVSDGVTAGDCGWISDELLSWSTNNMQDLAGHIAGLAAVRSDKTTRDDITAAAVKITKAP